MRVESIIDFDLVVFQLESKNGNLNQRHFSDLNLPKDGSRLFHIVYYISMHPHTRV